MAYPSRPCRFMLVSAALLLLQLIGQAESTTPAFQFSSCVTKCVQTSGCETSSPRCMCKAAKKDFLSEVVTCMSYFCKDDLRNVDGAFLDLMESGCKALKSPIPQTDLTEAESTASSLKAKLPATAAPPPQTTKAPPATNTAKPTKASSSSTSVAVVRTSSSTSRAPSPEAPKPSAPAQVPTPPAEPVSSETPVADKPRPLVPNDSSPFATFPSSGASRWWPSSIRWLGLPLLIVAVAFR